VAAFQELQRRLFGWRDDGQSPVRLDRRRIFILPSRAGLLFVLTLVVMLLGAINYNLALGHALVFLLAGLGLVGMVHAFRNLHGLRISPGRCAPVFAGESAEFILLLDNDRPGTRYGLVFEAEKGMLATTDLRGQEQTSIGIPVSASRRGWLALPRTRLSTRYPLGLFTAWSYLQPAMRCLVYPKPLRQALPDGLQAAHGSGNGSGGQEDFAGFREHQPTDSMHHVAWKASARDDGTRPLLVKQFAGGSDAELELAWTATDPALADETRLSVLAGWVLAADEGRYCYSLALPGVHVAATSGPAQRERCLEALALFRT
jgi:uncharacterized protein (DUF58 family)